MANFDLVIFDLDGTLLNTLDDLAASTNHALAAHGFPARTTEQVRQAIGNGVRNLIRLSVPEGMPEPVQAHVLADFKAHYTANVSVHTRPYPGILELLRALRAEGVRVAVNSNKVDSAVRLLCEAHFPGLIDFALGEREGIPKKPAPDGVRLIQRELDADSTRTLYVGDGDTDLLTAKNAGISGAWVSWGYRHLDELGGIDLPRAFDTVEALRAYILDRNK
ncbi:MAG: HAD-IA family hydrolase [Clostridia bacterium]|nr:HAD-IA family hydrolase [Clostridia bacterium]